MSALKKQHSPYVFYRRNRKRINNPSRSFNRASLTLRAALVAAANKEI